MNEKNSMDIIKDAKSDLTLKIQSLHNLPQDPDITVPFLINQLKENTSKEDTSLVIYILDSISTYYDSRFVPTLIELLELQDIELTFRIQCMTILNEFYRFSLLDEIDFMEFAKDDKMVKFNVAELVTAKQILEQNFVRIGDKLVSADRENIKTTLQNIMQNKEETKHLQEKVSVVLNDINKSEQQFMLCAN